MTDLQGYATSLTAVDEVISAYSSSPYEPQAYTTNAPQVVFASFTVPAAVKARLVVLGLNTGPAVLTATLYADGVSTTCSVGITSAQEQAFYSANYDFTPGVLYQVAVAYLGSDGMAAVRNVSLGASSI